MRLTYLRRTRTMRGSDEQQGSMVRYLSPERRVPQDHPLRPIRAVVETALAELAARFTLLYSHTCRPSIPPEKLLRTVLLQVLSTVRRERHLMEQLDCNLPFRWFVGLNSDDPIWDVTVFTKNRDRLLAGDVAQAFFDQVLARARERHLLSSEHFTVDEILLEAWAGQKSFKKTGDAPAPPPGDPGNPTVDFRGEPCTNAMHASTTDSEARLAKKAPGQVAKLAYLGHVLMENHPRLVLRAQITQTTGTARRETALALATAIPGNYGVTLGGDRGYDTAPFVAACPQLRVTPHVAEYTTRPASTTDGGTTRHPGYTVSHRKRKCVEEIFGWLKTVGLMRKLRHRGVARVGWMFISTTAAYNLVRMRNFAEAVG